MKHFFQFLVFFSIVLLTQCTADPVSDWEELNLLEYGAAVKIMAPKTVKVKSKDFMGMKDITVIDTVGNYGLQIFISDAFAQSISDVLEESKSDLKETPIFNEIVDSFPDGFIFNSQLDSATTSYDFRYLQKKGDKQIEYQMGMGKIYDLETVQQTIQGIRADK